MEKNPCSDGGYQRHYPGTNNGNESKRRKRNEKPREPGGEMRKCQGVKDDGVKIAKGRV